ncbi:carboxymuconolactone decarboxylase family protein [Salinibacterium sp. dk2585]|uniref:carboxymuconolactone decarboxylase family protein n=1 Tax=unclassified Salinibacterium TaxID=2632331 RepID=UPI0011C24EBC|nr:MULTISPECIES: carboxymuconolactone decarboxylase family protein [unclassified Salinibacterium]QEE61897.1 carboxymuconolactone decarboxylase family protein [Salinibacterium sp. dk2585]TXK54548.1 carboxymuconolactone decarboxylase family protein [Salinibacterium sp. dk5596]
MSIIETPTDDQAAGYTAELYAADIAHQGFVASHTRVMAMNPEAYAAWEQLITAIAKPMGFRRYELVTLAAAYGARSQHCRLAHGRKSLGVFGEEQLERIATDYRDADLSDAEVAMMEFAEKVSRDASSMTDADSLRLRELGFTDREIVDIALAAAARNYYSRAIQALAVEVDDVPEMSPSLRAALTAGL